mmetsp:Transcript_13484/g.30602  ORF Transcript_13484/g.30602 Transcript_13484/m.30602 type:complete len:285 (-) Transcript_13484:34-888(-)
MKLVLLLQLYLSVIVRAGPLSVAPHGKAGLFLRSHKQHKLSRDAMPQELGMLMKETQVKLSRAQAHHAKVVDKERAQLESSFTELGGALAEQIQVYHSALAGAEGQLEDAVNSAKSELARARSAVGATDWRSPAEEAVAKLAAEVASSERALQHARRQNLRAVDHAAEQAEEPLEDVAQKLSMKLGDMTPIFNEAKSQIGGMTDAGHASRSLQTASTGSNHSAAASAQMLLQAMQDERAQAKSAADSFAAFVANVSANVTQQGAGILKRVSDAERLELAKVSGA